MNANPFFEQLSEDLKEVITTSEFDADGIADKVPHKIVENWLVQSVYRKKLWALCLNILNTRQCFNPDSISLAEKAVAVCEYNRQASIDLEQKVIACLDGLMKHQLYEEGELFNYIPEQTYEACAEIIRWLNSLEEESTLELEPQDTET